jgi:hypothetical protein
MSASTASPKDFFSSTFPNASDVWDSSVTNVEFMATNAQNYQFVGAMTSIKATDNGSTDYYLAWVSQVNSQTTPTGTNWLQQWIAPKWSVTSGNYLNYVCQTQGTGANASQFIRNTATSAGDSMNTGVYSKISTANVGTAATDDSTTTGQSTPAADGNWTKWSCSGVRKAGQASASANAFSVGDTITYQAAFRYSQGAQATSPITGAYSSSGDLTYTVVEKTDSSLAVALTVSAAAVSAVASLAF